MLIVFNDVYNNWEFEFQNIVQFVWMGVHQVTILTGDLEQGLTIGWLLLRFVPLYKFPSITSLKYQILVHCFLSLFLTSYRSFVFIGT